MLLPRFIENFFWGLRPSDTFNPAMNALVSALDEQPGVFVADNLVACGRVLSFTRDAVFARAFEAHAKERHERGILWRTATLAWAARQAMRLEGAYVECGCYTGTTARILLDVVDFSARGAFLYDLFDHAEDELHHRMPAHGPGLFEQVKKRFSAMPYVTITQGRIPASLDNAPEKIALLHIDLNSRDSEIAALEILFERVVPGGIVILDDFGWLAYAEQHVAEANWFARRGYSVLELPTGQGLVIR